MLVPVIVIYYSIHSLLTKSIIYNNYYNILPKPRKETAITITQPPKNAKTKNVYNVIERLGKLKSEVLFVCLQQVNGHLHLR